MNARYPALDRLEALVNGLDAMGRDLGDRLGALAGRSVEGVSDSGLVVVDAGADGTITGVRVDPRAMRGSSQALAEEFLQAVTRAQEGAAELSKETVRDLLKPVPEMADRDDARRNPDERRAD